jgi:hypothetical protein
VLISGIDTAVSALSAKPAMVAAGSWRSSRSNKAARAGCHIKPATTSKLYGTLQPAIWRRSTKSVSVVLARAPARMEIALWSSHDAGSGVPVATKNRRNASAMYAPPTTPELPKRQIGLAPTRTAPPVGTRWTSPWWTHEALLRGADFVPGLSGR